MHHLARIEPVDDAHRGRVLTLGWKLLLNLSLMIIPVVLAGVFMPLLALVALVGSGKVLLLSAVAIPVAFAAQVSWAGTYPEWPMNQLLVWRLRRSCRRRMCGRSQQSWIDSARMVEWVPRENWSATKLDTARDVMLIDVSESGVRMEGDFATYTLPCASIIDVEVESIRPKGCFHCLHFVVITVRTEDGPTEFPLAYRDHQLGRLRSTHRMNQTQSLCQQIRNIATGGDFSFIDPEYDRRDRRDPSLLRVDQAACKVSQSTGDRMNPYATPRSL
ncbi:MAG: hypothetical protein KDB00_27105 [Planctomycetales bacterium]|nr:hypothetical protein [Planctomycetales bacterium]